MDLIMSFVTIAKYILLMMGLVGIVMLLLGLAKKERGLIQKGAYITIVVVVFFVCGYFVVKKTEQRIDNGDFDRYYQEQYEEEYQE